MVTLKKITVKPLQISPKLYLYSWKDLKQSDRASVSKLSSTGQSCFCVTLLLCMLWPSISSSKPLSVLFPGCRLLKNLLALLACCYDGKCPQMKRRPETRELQLDLQSGRHGLSEVWYWIQDPDISACRKCSTILNILLEFWLIIAGY